MNMQNLPIVVIGLGIPIVLLSILLVSVVNGDYIKMCNKYLKFKHRWLYVPLYVVILTLVILSIVLPFQSKDSKPNLELAEQPIQSVSNKFTYKNTITVKTDVKDVDINVQYNDLSIPFIADVIENPTQYKIVYYTERTGFITINSPKIEKK